MLSSRRACKKNKIKKIEPSNVHTKKEEVSSKFHSSSLTPPNTLKGDPTPALLVGRAPLVENDCLSFIVPTTRVPC